MMGMTWLIGLGIFILIFEYVFYNIIWEGVATRYLVMDFPFKGYRFGGSRDDLTSSVLENNKCHGRGIGPWHGLE